MIVRDIMTTKLITVGPDDTLAHAATLFRQYHFHHLPVTRKIYMSSPEGVRTTKHVFEGLLSSADIDLASALSVQSPTSEETLWQERRAVDFMHRAIIRVTPIASVAAAAQLLVERGLNYLPVVEYELLENENQVILVGLLTRSDMLTALSRAMGAFEPGMQIDILLSVGEMAHLAHTLLLAAEMHVHISSVLAAPDADGTLRVATLRLGTINPTPLLLRLREEGIHYSYGSSILEEN
jgi:acetoin utilization protein AcuB